MEKETIKQLNQFLQGNYMAIHTYDKYIQRIDDESIKKTLQTIQQNHKKHAAMIAERIQNLGGIPAHDVSFSGKVAEWIGTMKGTFETKDILKDAIAGEKRGIEKSKQLLDGSLDSKSFILVTHILNEDEKHIKWLEQYLH